MEVTREQVQAWVREEQEKIDLEKQEACSHSASGTLNEDKSVTCDDCKKVLIFDPNERSSTVEIPKASAAFFKGMGK